MRVQRLRTKGWRKPVNAVYVGRPSRWGNPFTIGCDAWRFSTDIPYRVPETIDEVLADYRYFADSWLMISPDWLRELRGKDLMCWCALDQGCHADVLIELIRERYGTNRDR